MFIKMNWYVRNKHKQLKEKKNDLCGIFKNVGKVVSHSVVYIHVLL